MPSYNDPMYDRWNAGNRVAYPNQGYMQQPTPQQFQYPFQQIFVQGMAGAQAYPFPPGCNFLVMWEADPNLSIFYVKSIDQSTGRPNPVRAYDYMEHVDQPAVHKSDLNKYVTTDQLQEFINSKFVTQDQLKSLIGNLSVGAQGRIVLNESDA